MPMIITPAGQKQVAYHIEASMKPTVTHSTKIMSDLESFTCPACEFQAKSKAGLAAHARSHKTSDINKLIIS